MADGYRQLRTFFEDVSGSVSITELTDAETPVAAKDLVTIFVQRIHWDVVSPGADGAAWQVTDSNGTVLTADLPADVAGHFERDLTAPGRPCKEGEGLVVTADPNTSGIVTWEAYRKLTGVGAA